MAESRVAPLAEPVIDTVWDVEHKVADMAESFVNDLTEAVPAARNLSASAFELARSIFDVQRDLSRNIVSSVDDTVAGIEDSVGSAGPDTGRPATARKAKPKSATS